MKTIFITITFLIAAMILKAQSDPANSENSTMIKVSVPVKSETGKVVFGLFQENNFLQNPTQSKVSQIQDGNATAIFSGITPGTYAIVIFHDKNENSILDFDENGIPKENYGVSNNTFSYGPPQWYDSKFNVQDQDIEMVIYF